VIRIERDASMQPAVEFQVKHIEADAESRRLLAGFCSVIESYFNYRDDRRDALGYRLRQSLRRHRTHRPASREG